MKKTPAYALFLFMLFGAALLPALCEEETKAAELQSQVMVQPGGAATPLLPFLDYYIDISRDMDIEEVSSQKMAAEFKPLALNQLPRVEGVCWLRFILPPLSPEARPETFLLDMGQSFPGVPILFDPERNELSGALEWREKSPSQRNIMLLPEEGSQAITCFIKIDGLPGPWFSPMIRSPQNAASNLSSLARSAAILALGVVMVICLLRGLGEKGQWRIWTALFVAVSLAQAILGMPAVSARLSMSALAAILCPGIALMLLPHVGRHLMQTPFHSKSIDIQLFLLSLPGAALALLPLIPGWSWLDRWVDAWPICTLIFAPTAIGAWIMGLGGARRFLTACIIPPLFTGFALAGLDFGFPPDILSSAPVWGIALCALIIAATRSPLLPRENSKKRRSKGEKSRDASSAQEEIIILDHPLDDPNLRLLPTQALPDPVEPKKQESPPADYMEENPERAKTLEERENALRAPLDEILRESAALGQCSLPPAVRQYAENIISSANMMADVVSGQRAPRLPAQAATKMPEHYVSFSLQRVLRNVHDAVAAFAESAGTALSWYIPPNLGRLYRGNEEELENCLYLLLESSVRASKNGSVHLSARRVPGSDDPGYILFSITDNGAGMPPKDRSSLAISRAWELIGQHGGYLAMEVGPNGADIALTMRFPVEGEEEQSSKTDNHIMLASDNTARRRELAEALAPLACRISQLGTIQEVLVCQSRDPAALLIAHGQMARPSAADTIHKFTSLAREAGFSKSFILAITEDDKQWRLLKHSGFTHAMQEPEDLETLRDTISALLQALQDTQSQPDEPTEGQKPLQEVDGQYEGIKEGDKLLFKNDGHMPDGAESSNPESPKSAFSQNPRLISESGPLPQDEELPAFEGPDWLKPAAPEQTQPDKKKRSGLIIPSDSNGDFSQNQKSDSKIITMENNETEGANSVSTHGKVSPDADNAQAPYNSIMEYVIGAENKESAAPEDRNELAKKSTPDSQDLSLRANPDGSANRNSARDAEEKKDVNGDPVVQALILELDDAMQAASSAYEAHDSAAVAEATGRIIREAENVGLRLLAKMASCVERAAKENDMNALSDLLPELVLAVERNRLALSQNRRESKQG